uniref:SPG11 vesicle trafficking associated, spatacsin n=1 Tax=Callorhinchus milii TaxID=7868 RepID=A0A4W3JY75_CALMI
WPLCARSPARPCTAAGACRVRPGSSSSESGRRWLFIWETTANSHTSPTRQRLLALNSRNDLGIYELHVQDGVCDVTNSHSCNEEALRKLIKSKNLSLPLSFEVKILSFKDSKSFILLDSCILLHVFWLEGTSEADALDGFGLCLPQQTPGTITDGQICQEMLFLLDSAGWIYIYSTVDGKQLGSVHLAICQSGFTEETNELCDLSNLTRLWVSHELDVVVVVNCFNCAFCVDLEIYFRKHPEHLRRVSKASVNLPLKAPAGIDEDEIASAVYSDKVLNLPFQTDRSWKARLATFYNQTKAPSAEGLQNRSPSSWYNHLSPPNPNDVHHHIDFAQSQQKVTKVFAQREDVNKGLLANELRGVVQLQGLKETMRVETVSVSGFSILFSLATPDSESVTVVFWDLETQEVMYHHLDGHCVPVEDDGKEQLCLFLTDSGLSMVLFGFSQEDLLNHLMIYGKAGIVDSLCHLNHWSRCSIPIHALEVIEMEIAADFLNYILNWYCSSGDFTTIHLWVYVEEITPALDLLCSAIRENDSETQSKQFSEQLLNLTLTFLNKQMQELLMQSAELDECKQKCVDYLTGYITELRKFMKKYPRTPPNESVTKEWCSCFFQEVIRDAILSDCIPQAQAYFRTQQNPAKSLQQLVQAGLNLTYNCLLRKDLKEASALLKNMVSNLQDIARIYQTFYLWDILQNQNCFSEQEKEMVKFVHSAEKLYSSSGDSMECPLSMHSCSPEVLWSHLTSRHCWSKLCAWIETPQSAESPENWPLLTQETVNQNTLCSSYMRNEILDKLARKGVYIPSELADFKQLLLRLGCTGGIMQEPHPVPTYQSSQGLDFHNCFVLYCLEHGLRYLLYAYLDYYRLNPSNCQILADGALHVGHPWFEFLVRIREVSNSTTPVTFQASLANAQMLIPSNQASVSSMLLEGHTLLALATIMFAPGGIDQVIQEREDVGNSLWKVDPQLLKMALAPYPKLRAALFPQHTPHGIPPPDVSLYHLLQSLHPFDPQHLFGWQSSNTLSAYDSSDLPHFSCPDLVNKYAITERLDFPYYLHHGRPSFAFATFLVQQLAKSSSPKQLIQQVSSEVYTLGLAHFAVAPVAAACVAFLELLGVTSLKLRVDLKVAATILKHWYIKTEESQHSSIQETLAEKLQSLVECDKSSAQELLSQLENATWENLQTRNIKRYQSWATSGQEWSLITQFCRLHSIAPSIAYLRECAQQDSWLEFVVFAQLHNYQPDEVLALLRDFSPTLQDHLTLAFETLQFVPLEGSVSSETLGTPKSELNKKKKREESPVDLYQVLYWCQEKPNPWRYLLTEAVRHHAPVLSILAYLFLPQHAEILQCLCVWVIMSSDETTYSEATKHIDDSVEHHEWGLHDLAVMWKVLLGRRKSKQLIWGFQLFQKDCPWVYMLEMYKLCTEDKNYQEAKLKLQEFQKYSEAGAITLLWLEQQAYLLLKLMLQQCPTQYELGKLLNLLADVDGILKLNGPDFQKLSTLSHLLQDTDISIDRSLLTKYSTETLKSACGQILGQLQEKRLFALARQVAELAELPVDNLVVQEVIQEIVNLKRLGQWQRKETRINFWKKCHDCFRSNVISNRAASNFFLTQASDIPSVTSHPAASVKEQLLNIQEKCLLFTMAGHWLSHNDSSCLSELEEVEKSIWLCRVGQQKLLRASVPTDPRDGWQVSDCGEDTFDSVTREFSFSKLAALNSPDYLKLGRFPTREAVPGCRLEAEEKEALTALIGELLDGGYIHEASRVCGYFSFYNQDTSLVLHCRALASGEAHTADSDPSIRVILTTGACFNGDMGLYRKRVPSGKFVLDGKDQVAKELQILTNECHHGKSYCRQVLSLYDLSKELGCSYNDISSQDSETVLQEVLSSQQPDRYKKAQAFITTQGLKAEAVAALVAEEVLQALLWPAAKQIYNPLDGKEAFLQLAKLCQDPILVGTKLLDKISSIPNGALECMVELLILAHDCFSLTCHMEGISRVLQAARHLSHKHLAPNEEYSLMVRLITGIGRYNDMTYIFDLLHENHRFEMLLRKNVDSNGNLKTALLDYIKRCLPGDSEKHNMVAFCFSMCREIGENHEGAARVQLKIVESQPWGECLKKSLVKVLTFLKDAAESYSKDCCIRRATQCVKLAKLVTLQLHFLNNNHNTQLINLQRSGLMPCILSLPRFYQAAIVAEAYDFVPDWAEVLYQHVIVRGEFTYLEEFKQQHSLQQSLFEEISNKFKQHKGDTAASQNLKRLLQCCEDVYLFYKLAFEHNFNDIANKLLKEPQTSCYLKDMIAS